jgi:hypothetical protein
MERENRRRRITLDDPNLVPDVDPKAWMPKGARQASSATLAASLLTATGTVMR